MNILKLSQRLPIFCISSIRNVLLAWLVKDSSSSLNVTLACKFDFFVLKFEVVGALGLYSFAVSKSFWDDFTIELIVVYCGSSFGIWWLNNDFIVTLPPDVALAALFGSSISKFK